MKKVQLIGALALVFATTANANLIQDTRYVSPNTTSVERVQVNGNAFNTHLGSYNIEVNSQQMAAFCVDPFQWTSKNLNDYTVKSLESSDVPTQFGFADVKNLFGLFYDTLNGDAQKTAGFHYALWEVFHDDGELNTGSLQFLGSTAVAGYASSFIQAAIDATDNNEVSEKYDFTLYQSDDHQDYLSVNAVPVPAALPLFASALAGFGVARRRKTV